VNDFDHGDACYHDDAANDAVGQDFDHDDTYKHDDAAQNAVLGQILIMIMLDIVMM
jgi:hypothetical protein